MSSPGGLAINPMTVTSAFSVFALEPFPTIREGDSITDAVLNEQNRYRLLDGDIIVVASKVVSISEKRHVDLDTVTPSPRAREISAQTGKPAAIVQQPTDHHHLRDRAGQLLRGQQDHR